MRWYTASSHIQAQCPPTPSEVLPKSLLLGLAGRKRPMSAQLTDEVVHSLFAHTSPLPLPRVDASAGWLYSGRPRRVAPTGYDGNPWSLRYGFCQSKPPTPGRGAPWCSRENKPICTYKPKTFVGVTLCGHPGKQARSHTQPRGFCDEGSWCGVFVYHLAHTTPWSLQPGA